MSSNEVGSKPLQPLPVVMLPVWRLSLSETKVTQSAKLTLVEPKMAKKKKKTLNQTKDSITLTNIKMKRKNLPTICMPPPIIHTVDTNSHTGAKKSSPSLMTVGGGGEVTIKKLFKFCIEKNNNKKNGVVSLLSPIWFKNARSNKNKGASSQHVKQKKQQQKKVVFQRHSCKVNTKHITF